MAIRAGNGVGAAARNVAEHASALARLELELAAQELKRKVGSLAAGIALLGLAGVVGLIALALAVAGAAAGVATALPTWAALLVVSGGALLLAAVLGLAGVAAVRKGTPPVPEQALAEARKTTEALRSNGGD